MIVEMKKRSLLVAKGTFEAMRGAERDLIRNLPALARHFEVTMATLQSSRELKECCQENSITLLKPAIPWYPETGTLATVLNRDLRKSTKAWRGIPGLKEALAEADESE